MSEVALWRRLLAEVLGSAFLSAVVIGSGIAAQQLSPGSVGLELLENAAATAAGLYTIILMFGAVSGGHFNPVVSLVDAALGGLRWRDAIAYVPAQVGGCVGGAAVANLMFSKAVLGISTHHRASGPHFVSEIVATLGLLLVIFALARSGRSGATPAAVGAYIGAAYFFTSSASFANPAITVGRMFSNSFAGIAPSSVPSFVGAQLVGGLLALAAVKVLYPPLAASGAAAVIAAPASPGSGRATMTKRPVVLFLCTHNAGRSLAARVLLDDYAKGRIDVRSAGSEPADALNPAVVAVLRERGLDPSRELPKALDERSAREADVIVTMGCGDSCPVFPGKRYLDWDLEDPARQPIDSVRPIVDEIDQRVRALLAELLPGTPP